MYEKNFPNKRYKHTAEFLLKHISTDAKILDLGVENPFTQIMKQQGFAVKSTHGEDLDLDTSTIENSSASKSFSSIGCQNWLLDKAVPASIPSKAIYVVLPSIKIEPGS